MGTKLLVSRLDQNRKRQEEEKRQPSPRAGFEVGLCRRPSQMESLTMVTNYLVAGDCFLDA